MKNVSELLHKEQKYWIEEAVAEETQRGERRKKMSDATAAAMLAPEPAAPCSRESD